MRIIHVIFVVALAMDAYTAESLAGKSEARLSAGFFYGMIFVAAMNVLIAVYFRQAKLPTALQKLRREPNDPDGLKQWRFVNILTMALVLSVGLYGFTLRFLGASQHVSWLFFLVALILLMIWRPKLELDREAAGASRNQ